MEYNFPDRYRTDRPEATPMAGNRRPPVTPGTPGTGAAPRAELQGRAIRELSIAHQLVTTRLNRALRPLGITMTHTSLLFHLARSGQGCSVSEIADAMEVNQPAVSKTLRALADRGAVAVETADDDARRRTVQLTPDGQQLLYQAMAAMDPEATIALDALDDRRLGDLVALLGDVRQRLDEARRRQPARATGGRVVPGD